MCAASESPKTGSKTPGVLGLSAALALVIGGQVGSGAFMAPALLAPFGLIGIKAWGLAGFGALCLAFVFSKLCRQWPTTGGPPLYIQAIWGDKAAFFVGWLYWASSWISTSVVIGTMGGYVVSLVGTLSPVALWGVEVALLALFLWCNMRGIHLVGRIERILTALKICVFGVLPLAALSQLDFDHFTTLTWSDLSWNHQQERTTWGALMYITLWGFVGLETATIPAGHVHNPQRTIPRAVIGGTALVALLYALSSFCMVGSLPAEQLAQSQAPYADIARSLWGAWGEKTISIMGLIVCMGTLNAWIMISGHVAWGLADQGLFPRWLKAYNTHGTPSRAFVISSLGLVPLLGVMCLTGWMEGILMIVDISMTALVIVYGLCCLVYLICCFRDDKLDLVHVAVGCFALFFCTALLISAPLWTHLGTLVMLICGGIVRWIMPRHALTT